MLDLNHICASTITQNACLCRCACMYYVSEIWLLIYYIVIYVRVVIIATCTWHSFTGVYTLCGFLPKTIPNSYRSVAIHRSSIHICRLSTTARVVRHMYILVSLAVLQLYVFWYQIMVSRVLTSLFTLFIWRWLGSSVQSRKCSRRSPCRSGCRSTTSGTPTASSGSAPARSRCSARCDSSCDTSAVDPSATATPSVVSRWRHCWLRGCVLSCVRLCHSSRNYNGVCLKYVKADI